MKPVIESPLVMLALALLVVVILPAMMAAVYETWRDRRWLRDDRDVLPEPNWRSARGGHDVW